MIIAKDPKLHNLNNRIVRGVRNGSFSKLVTSDLVAFTES